jgi:hypothetical protein
MSTPTRRWQLLASALGLLSLALFAVAAEVSPPNVDTSNADNPVPIDVPAAVLDDYTGDYELSGKMIVKITRSGSQLSSQLTGQPAYRIYPSAATEFFYKGVKARISFVKEPSGKATSIVLHQNGNDITAPRVDPAVAQQIEATLQAKVRSQMATPGTEAAVRRMIAWSVSGNPDYSQISPELGKAVREQSSRSKDLFTQLGAVESLEFKGVGTLGWDIYDVRFEHGSGQYRIVLSDNGIITGALFSMGP